MCVCVCWDLLRAPHAQKKKSSTCRSRREASHSITGTRVRTDKLTPGGVARAGGKEGITRWVRYHMQWTVHLARGGNPTSPNEKSKDR